MTLMYLDIETVASTDASVVSVKCPGNIKKPESIAKWEAEDRPQAILDALANTVFDGTYGKIVCIGYAFDDGPVSASCCDDEKKLIWDLFSEISTATLIPPFNQVLDLTVCGHNVAGFDLPFIRKRAMIHNIKPPRALLDVFAAKPWAGSIADTMRMWDSDQSKRIKLDALCKVLGIPTPKGDMDGSKVGEAFAAGEYSKIATYCAADVEATRACYKRMTWQ